MLKNFSFQRLYLLFRKQWLENSRFYGLASLALLGVMAIVFVVFWIMMGGPHYHEGQTMVIYFVGLYLLGSLYASTAFQALDEKEKGQYLLSLPATHAEKLVTVIVFTTVFFFLVYTACFLLVKWLAVAYVHYRMQHESFVHFQALAWDKNDRQIFSYLLIGFFSLQSLFLLGSVYFRKYAYVKTILAAICFSGIYIFLVVKSIQFFVPAGYHFEGYRVVQSQVPEGEGYYRAYGFGKDFLYSLVFIAKWLWIPVFWTAAWFRLKEKEI